jgi:hypothetical protein
MASSTRWYASRAPAAEFSAENIPGMGQASTSTRYLVSEGAGLPFAVYPEAMEQASRIHPL